MVRGKPLVWDGFQGQPLRSGQMRRACELLAAVQRDLATYAPPEPELVGPPLPPKEEADGG